MEFLPKTRQALQTEVRDLVRKYGPELGDLYYEEDVQWDQVMKKVRTPAQEFVEKSLQSGDAVSSNKKSIRSLSNNSMSPGTIAEQQDAAFACDIVDDEPRTEDTTYTFDERAKKMN